MSEWQQLPFDRVAIAQSDKGRRIKQRDYLPAGKVPVIDQGQEPIGGYTDDAALAFDGELPVVLFGDHTRAVKLVSQQFAVGADGIKIFRPADGVQPKYLYYWMRSAPIPDRGYGRHYQYLRQLVVPVPPPTAQDGIVAEIEKQFSRLDEAVAGLKRVKANLKRYKAAILKAAVESRLVPTEADLARREGRNYETGAQLLQRILDARRKQWQGKGKYKEPASPDATDLTELPVGWAWSSVDQLTENFDGTRIPVRAQDRAERQGKYPYYGASGVIDHVDDYLFDGEYLLIAEDGANLLSRNTPIAFSASGKFWVNNHAHIVRTRGGIPMVFLGIVLNGKNLAPFVTGSAQPKLTQAALNKIPVPLPPLPEQHRIVAEVDRLLSIAREAEAEVETNLKRAQALRQATLQAAFATSSPERQ